MPIDQTPEQLNSLHRELCCLTKETERVKFEHDNNHSFMIRDYISALANSAALLGKQTAYVVWCVDNEKLDVVGTTL